MLFNIAVQHSTDYLLVIGTGLGHVCDLCALHDVARTVSRIKGHRHVILDLRLTTARLSPEEVDELTQYALSTLSHVERTAVVLPVGGEIFDLDALAGGLRLGVFFRLDPALRWLGSGHLKA